MYAPIPRRWWRRRLARFARLDDRGMPLIEFALALPVLILLSLGVIEVGLYLLVGMKLQSSATSIANLVTAAPSLSQADLDDIFESARSNMAPFDVGSNTSFVISSVEADPDVGAAVGWQQAGAGSLAATSEVGATAGPATIPADIPLDDASLIVVEAFYNYDETLLGLVPSRTIYKVVYYRPRFGS